MKRILAIAGLTGLWLLLWRDISAANVASGVVLAAVVTAGVRAPTGHRVRPLAALGFAVYFLRRLIEANLVLAREVVTPQNQIKTGIIAVPLPGCSDLVVTLAANATSLTPGTLTLEVDRAPDPVVYVHVLHLHDIEDARADVADMAARIKAVFPQTGGDR